MQETISERLNTNTVMHKNFNNLKSETNRLYMWWFWLYCRKALMKYEYKNGYVCWCFQSHTTHSFSYNLFGNYFQPLSSSGHYTRTWMHKETKYPKVGDLPPPLHMYVQCVQVQSITVGARTFKKQLCNSW
jgi:hypothetical protein